MKATRRPRRNVFTFAGWFPFVCGGVLLTLLAARELAAASGHHKCQGSTCGSEFCPADGELGGTWFWMRSPEEEKRVVMGLFNRYCIRCHGVDGRGVWDIPGIPDFTNVKWQASRSDTQIARIILEGRGAVMPPFRGTLTLEEACAMARYLRTFVPGTEAARPDFSQKKTDGTAPATLPATPPVKPETAPQPSKVKGAAFLPPGPEVEVMPQP